MLSRVASGWRLRLPPGSAVILLFEPACKRAAAVVARGVDAAVCPFVEHGADEPFGLPLVCGRRRRVRRWRA